MTANSPGQTVQHHLSDTEILSSGEETKEAQQTRTGVPTCSKCRKPMMPRTKDGDWFWGCQDYPKCRGPTTNRPPVPERLRKAAEARFSPSTPESSKEAGCSHPLTRAWGNAAGRGRKCLLCGTELETEKTTDEPRRNRRSSHRDRAKELEEASEQIAQAEAEVRAVSTLLDEAMKADEGLKKAMMRAAKTKLNTSVRTHLEVAQGLVRGPSTEEKASGSERPSRSA